VSFIDRELILAELKRTREALDKAIAYVESETVGVRSVPTSARTKVIKIGEGRAIAILAGLRDSGGKMAQRDFEDVCLRNSRTLVGAGGFIARGSITRQVTVSGDIVYELTEKGIETVIRWESRYGTSWINNLENPDVLGNSDVLDQQKVRLLAQ